tara:strand:+ start:339 stop:953 length:615 start_codon:yes stop_codon:yes gene_type:complete
MTAWLRRISPVLVLLTVVILTGLSVWVTAVRPNKVCVVVIPAVVCIAGILVFELHARTLSRRVAESHRLLVRSYAFGGGALVMVLGPGMKLAVASGVLDAAVVPVARQIGGVVFGLALMGFGNFLPKLISPWRVAEEPFDWQGVHRFCGRMFMVAGAVVIWVWLAWPAPAASPATLVAFGLAALLSVGRKFYSLATWRGPAESA